MKKIILFVISLLVFQITYSETISAVKSGNWNDPTTWDLGRVPQDGDDVNINNNYTVTVAQSVNYTDLSVTIGWSGSLVVSQGQTLTITAFSSSNGGGSPVQIDGRLNVYGSVSQTGGTVNIGESGYMYVTGDYSTSGGDQVQLNVDGTLETGTLTTSSITATIGPEGKIIVHGDFTNQSGANFTINGGEFTIDGNYNNQGDATITINDGGLLHIKGDYINSGGSDIVVNDGTVIIDGNVSNSGGSTFTIADGSNVEVGGDLSNTGGGQITVDGSLAVEGDLINRGGSTITGDGSLYVGGTIDDPEDNIDPDLLTTTTLHTIGSGDWFDSSIWSTSDDNSPCNCTPSINSIVTISANTSVTVNNTAKAKDLTIEQGASLTLQPEANVTVFENFVINGTLTMENDLSNTPNLIDQGTVSFGSDCQVVTKLMVGGKKYTYIGNYIPGVPTSSIQTVDGYSNPNVYQYDETKADNWEDDDPSNDYIGWVSPSSTMTPGQGFAVYTDRDYTYTLSGKSFTTGDVSVDITLTVHSEFTNSSEVDGWNLIANPYPSSIDATAFLDDNSTVLDGNIYLWDDDYSEGSDYSSQDYIQYNKTGTIYNSANGADFNGYIAPNQAFLVKAISSGTVVFHNSQRNSESSHLIKAVKSEPIDFKKIKLALCNDSLYNETLIAFSTVTTDSFDYGYDGYKRSGNSDISFYSLSDNYKYGIQALSDSFIVQQIPLGYKVSTAGTYSVYLKQYNTPINYFIAVYDKANDQTHDLLLSPYTFYTDQGQYDNRLYLIVEKTSVATESKQVKSLDLSVYMANHTLFVSNQTDENYHGVDLKVFDLQGKAVLSRKLDLYAHSTQLVNLRGLNPGIYLVQLYSPQIIKSAKIEILP